MQIHYTHLVWDSSFFFFPVGKIDGSIDNQRDFEKAIEMMTVNDCRLAYYSSPEILPAVCADDPKVSIALVDKKVTYVKKVNLVKMPVDVCHIPPDADLSQLEYLAIASGTYSRFRVDERIGSERFEELYRLWIKESVERRFALEVLGFRKDEAIIGLITLGEKGRRGNVGIIAVDAGNRGLGIGRKLMNGAEAWFKANGYHEVQVVTQQDNVVACRLYENCGYILESVEYYYHIWREH